MAVSYNLRGPLLAEAKAKPSILAALRQLSLGNHEVSTCMDLHLPYSPADAGVGPHQLSCPPSGLAWNTSRKTSFVLLRNLCAVLLHRMDGIERQRWPATQGCVSEHLHIADACARAHAC